VLDEITTAAPRKRHGFGALLRAVLRSGQGVFGCIVLVLLVALAVLSPIVATHDPASVDVPARLSPPSGEHWLGTDHLGRDVFSRVVYGSRTSILAGVVATTIAITLGTLLGLVAGYLHGSIDNAIMRVTDALLAFPELVLMIAFAAIFGPGLTLAMIAIGIASVPRVIRLVRGQVLAVRALEYVEATRALGSGSWRVIGQHILPNVTSPIIVWGSMLVGTAILAEAGLSFLGLGTQPPTPSWGSMINQGNQYLRLAPWISIFPGLAIFITVLGANLLGDALRDALDPRQVWRR
jgi:peptide/nickel transport system permease protein